MKQKTAFINESLNYSLNQRKQEQNTSAGLLNGAAFQLSLVYIHKHSEN